jgi:hypothetical protein
MTIRLKYPDRIPTVVRFELLENYKIHLWFDDGLERTIDFAPILFGPLWGPLRDLQLFQQVSLVPGFGTLEWPNGADIDPTVLHDWPDHVDYIIEKRKRWLPEPQNS